MPRFSQVDPAQLIALSLALGIGLLIGLERERRKGVGPDRRAAGIRSFALVAVSGAFAQLLPAPRLVVVGGAFVALLAAISHLKSRTGDPGLTTELALFVTYLVGVLGATQPLLGSACGVTLALLLNTRTRLHRFATQVLTEQELRDGLLLCSAALIVLPLIPNRPLAWLGEINPRPLAAIAVLILTLQAVSATWPCVGWGCASGWWRQASSRVSHLASPPLPHWAVGRASSQSVLRCAS